VQHGLCEASGKLAPDDRHRIKRKSIAKCKIFLAGAMLLQMNGLAEESGLSRKWGAAA
jgi:hypothetical protein